MPDGRRVTGRPREFAREVATGLIRKALALMERVTSRTALLRPGAHARPPLTPRPAPATRPRRAVTRRRTRDAHLDT